MPAQTWSGKTEELPAEGVQFIYNGVTYYWRPCNCSPYCQRPVVHRADNGREDRSMTIRARGLNQGNPVNDVLLNTGLATIDQIIKADAAGPLAFILLAEPMMQLDELRQELGDKGLNEKFHLKPGQLIAYDSLMR